MGIRRPPTGPDTSTGQSAPSCGHEHLDREVSAVARALCRVMASSGGGNADMRKILVQEFRVSAADADSIIAAAERNWP
jgi:hypothetical protein